MLGMRAHPSSRHFIVSACLVISLLALNARAGELRDWKAYPAVVEIDKAPENLYALGDVHGDYDRLASLLFAAKLIAAVPDKPEAVEWKGGSAVLVCTGNLIDQYNQSLQVVAFFRAPPETGRQGRRARHCHPWK